MQENHSDCLGVAQHALVLGPSGHVQSKSTEHLSNLNFYAWLLEPQQSRSRASLRQWQHELRLLREDQPDQSMRQWIIFTKWCLSNKVDLRAPPIKSVADFLVYLFRC